MSNNNQVVTVQLTSKPIKLVMLLSLVGAVFCVFKTVDTWQITELQSNDPSMGEAAMWWLTGALGFWFVFGCTIIVKWWKHG